MSLKHIHVRAQKDFRTGEPTGDIQVYGYLKDLNRRKQLSPSFELSLDNESAKALVGELLTQLTCESASECAQLLREILYAKELAASE